MLDEARSKDQQIKGQQAMLDQKIKAEYDSITKDIPRKKKKVTTGIGSSPYQVYKAPPAGNYVPAPKRTNEDYINEISGASLIKNARKAKNETDTLRAKLEPGYKNKRTKQMHKFAIGGVKKLRSEVEEDYKNLPRDRMAKQYDRKKDKNYDEFHKQNPMGIGPRVSRGKSDTQIDQHGNSRQTKAISGQLKNNPRFYDSSHEQWQRMQSKFKSRKNSDATGEVARRLNPKSYGEEYKNFPSDKVERKLKKVVDSIEKNPKDLGFKNTLKKRRIGNLKAELSTDERERESQSKFISKINKRKESRQ